MIRWGTGNGRRLALAAGTAVVVGLAALSSAWAFSGASGSPFPTGEYPGSVVIADFNGDGHADLVTANQSEPSGLSVLLGDGAADPHFTEVAGSPFPVDGYANTAVTGDFNGDGRPDLAVSCQDNGQVSVLLGDGTGGFPAAPGSPFAVSGQPYTLAVADVNGDGKVDLATADYNPWGVSVLLGNGAGAFSKAGSSPVAPGVDVAGLAIGDVNGDGKPDLVATRSEADAVSVFLGDGAPDPSFTPANGSPFPAGAGRRSYAVTIGDVNGDGKPDLVTVNDFSSTISVLLGDGAAQPNFTPAAGSPIGTGDGWPTAVALGDVDGDGHVDAVLVHQDTNDVPVLLGDGTGGFTPATGSPFPTNGSGSYALAIGDMNSDARIDLVTANYYSNDVSVLLNPIPAQAATTTTTEPATTTTTAPAATTTTGPAAATNTTGPAAATTTTQPATTTTTQPAMTTTPTTTTDPRRRGASVPRGPVGNQSALPRTGADSTAPLVAVAVVLMSLGGLLLVARRRLGAS